MDSPSSSSVTHWLSDLKCADEEAAQKLWHRFVERLIHVASKHLKDFPQRGADEEDVVVVAFGNFLRGVNDGRIARLQEGDDLWQVLVMLTERALALIRHTWEEPCGT